MEIHTVLLILAAFIFALGVAVFQYYRTKTSVKLRIVLTTLRFTALFAALVLLINPEFSKFTYQTEKANLILLVDESASIRYTGQENNVKNILEAFATQQELNSKFAIHSYSFSKNVEPLDSLGFTGSYTDIYQGLRNIKETFANTSNAVVLITDGNHTYGQDYEFFTVNDRSLLHAVVVGDTTRYQDVAVGIINSNRYAFLNNQFPVEIQALYTGNTNERVRARVLLEGNLVHQETINFSSIEQSHTIATTIKASSTGVKTLKVVLDELNGEQNIQNNTKEFSIEVIDERTVVGFVSAFNHPDFGALKKAIESNEQRQVTFLTPQATRAELEKVDVFVLYQPNSEFENIYNFLDQRGGGSFTICGSQTDWNFLNRKLQHFTLEAFGQQEEILPLSNPAFDLFDISEFDVDDFPPLDGELGELNFGEAPNVLAYQKIRGVNLEAPLFFVFDSDENRKQAFLLGENIWKWRMQTFRNNQDFSSFDSFLGKLIFFLSSSGKKERLRITYNNVYENASEALIQASFFDNAYRFDSNATLRIFLKDENGQSREIPMLLSGNQFEVDLSDLEEGDYTFTVTETNERISKSGQFKIQDFDVEKQLIRANNGKLSQLASRNAGRLFYPNQTNVLISDLLQNKEFVPIQKSTRNVVSLIDFRIVLGLMVLALAIEWFVRKYNGLI